MRGISAAATGVIVAMAACGCFSSEAEGGSSFGVASVTTGATGGDFETGGGGSASTTAGGGPSSEHVGATLGGFDADAVLGADGPGGAAGAAGATDAADAAGAAGHGGAPAIPPAPTVPEGALLAAAWDDNANFEWFNQRLVPSNTDAQTLLQFDATEVADARAQAQSAQTSRAFLDIALVLDTTGSMGDELAYLKREVRGLWNEIALAYPESEQRWALIAYRDEGDNYVHVPYDFSADADEYLGVLEELKAEGGGDLPEASDQALRDLQTLSWRSDAATARFAFWFSDAPHHTERSEELASALIEAKQLGVKLYPVASENASEATTYSMRSAAQITGGRYLFLLGSQPDLVPAPLPCYYISELNALLLRVVHIEMDGRYHAPTRESLLGVKGDPTQGSCTSTQAATAF